jgi:hypothetical protein
MKLSRGNVMVIIFQSRKALNHLLQRGVVFTFRLHRRKAGMEWVTDRRGGHKIADVIVEEEGVFTRHNLGLYVEFSGFNTLQEWIEEVWRLNKRIPERGWLYRVTLIRAGCEPTPP